MPESLPEVLLRVAAIGPYRFEWVTQRSVWKALSESAQQAVVANLGVSADEFRTVLEPEAIYSRRRLLAANAFFVADDGPSESLLMEWKGVMYLRRRFSDDELSRHGAETFKDFQEHSTLSAKFSAHRSEAQGVFSDEGLEWDKDAERAKVIGKQGRPKRLLSKVVADLNREWPAHGVTKALEDRIAHSVRWFFQPELLTGKTFVELIRDNQ